MTAVASQNKTQSSGSSFGKAFDIVDALSGVAASGAGLGGSIVDIIYADRVRRSREALRDFGRDLKLENLGQNVLSRSSVALSRNLAQGFRNSFTSTQLFVRGGIEKQRLLDQFVFENEVQRIENERDNIGRIVNVVSSAVNLGTDIAKTIATAVA